MIRVKRGNVRVKRRKKFLKLAKGFRKPFSNLGTFAKEQVYQSLNYAYIGRKLKKRTFRTLWIQHINTFCHINNDRYSLFLGNLQKANIFLNRKMLSLIIAENRQQLDLLYNKFRECF